MELHNLKPAKGATKKRKRIARGQGSGKGGTATRGHKGAKSRSGYSQKIGFEGGQMPLQRRIPKRGFKNINRKEYVVFNLNRIEEMVQKHKIKSFDFETLRKLGMVQKNDLVKVLAFGELKSGIPVHAHKFSAKAEEGIKKAGGSAHAIAKPIIAEAPAKESKGTSEEE